MSKSKATTADMNRSDVQSSEISNQPDLYTGNKIEQATTARMEELWDKLSHDWPAVQKNPEIVEKIERLWSDLKRNNNESIAIPSEIEAIINTTLSAPSSPVNINHANAIPTIIDKSIYESITKTSTSSEEIDELLAEILGESYPVIKTNTDENNSHNISSININEGYITGSKELDEMVADILGEGWEKEGTVTSASNTTSAPRKSTENLHDNSNAKDSPDTNDDIDLDALIGSSLNDSKLAHQNQVADIGTPVPDGKLLELTNIEVDKIEAVNVINSSESTGVSSLSGLEAEPGIESLDDIIEDILHNGDIESVVSVKQTVNEAREESSYSEELNALTEPYESGAESADEWSITNDIFTTENPYTSTEDESLDKSSHPILWQEDETETGPSPITITTAHRSQDNNIDELVSDILKEEDESASDNEDIDEVSRYISEFEATSIESTEIKNEPALDMGTQANIDATPVRRSSSGTSKTSSVSNRPKTVKSPAPQTIPRDKGQHENNTIAVTSLILAVVLIATLGSWQYFASNKEPASASAERNRSMNGLSETSKSATVFTETESYVSDMDTMDTMEDEQHYSSLGNTSDTENFTQYDAGSIYAETDYTARIEQTDNEITIIINEPSKYELSASSENVATGEGSSDNDESPYSSTSEEDRLVNNDMMPPVKETMKTKASARHKPTIILHIVKKGDTLWAIAKRYVDDPYKYPELAKVSKIKNPDRIYPGNKIRIIKYSR